MIRATAVAIFLCLGAAVFADEIAKIETDEFTGVKSTRLAKKIDIRCGAKQRLTDGVRDIKLDIGVFEKDDTRQYALYIRTVSNGWIFIERGESLLVLADGELWKLSGDGSSGNRDFTAGSHYERAHYETDAATLHALARAKAVKMRIITGKGRNIEREVGPKQLAQFRRFVDAYIPAPESAEE